MESVFTCRMCGECCLGAGGIILQERDAARLAAHLGLSPEAFAAAHAERAGSRLRLKVGDDGYCTFFDHDISGCGVHLARPDVCRAWPFFRGNLLDEASWEMAATSCPGIDKRAGHDEFARQGKAYLQRENLAREQGDDPPSALLAVDDESA